jgi:hypothetical protein
MAIKQSEIKNIIRKYRLELPVYVTCPRMPILEDYVKKLEMSLLHNTKNATTKPRF